MRPALLRFRSISAARPSSSFRLFSTSQNNDVSEAAAATTITSQEERMRLDIKDVSNKEFKEQIAKYWKGDEDELPTIMESILRRSLVAQHPDTDDELIEELRMKPLDDVKDQDVESDFEELYDTDKEVDDLFYAKELVEKRVMDDEFCNIDDNKWDAIVSEAMKHGALKDMRECEEILEDMINWDKLLPDEIKVKVEQKFHELGDMCERGELEVEEAHELFKKFEDEMVLECKKIMDAEKPSELDEVISDIKVRDDPPGEGPILRWETRAVFPPGGDSWHPKNRKVKLSVTVKEFGLSKHQFRRLRELVGKRYHSGKDELTIISERYEHREENRKDCLRTLIAIMEEARKADKLVEDARTAFLKDRLKSNSAFMERLAAKVEKLRSPEL
uniref:Small ribosomal subunit protein mS35 mitochondrial conserved domain-containing protein n=1 Tax=Kalanchoe fedtschenkoi TaxID=63787 RepID=A0A7N0RI71_KALFE